MLGDLVWVSLQKQLRIIMSGTFTNSNTSTFTEARARYVLGKMKDDFIKVAYRGFSTITEARLMKWWDDIAFVANQKALIKCELQFTWDGKSAAVIYEIIADGSIHVDAESATVNFYLIPAHATVGIVIRRDHSNATVSKYLEDNGWTATGNFVEGTSINAGGYSRDGFGVNIKTIGL